MIGRRDFLKKTGLAAGAICRGEPVNGTATEDEKAVVAIHVHADQFRGELRPIWRFFGADEPNYAYMKDGKKLLAELGEMRSKSVYFRTHNLLTFGDGTPALKWGSTGAYREDAQGNPLYTRLQHFRIDEDHSNAFSAWKRMGSPPRPTPEQYAQLEKAGQLTALGEPNRIRVRDAKATMQLTLPRQSVALLVIG